MIRLSEHDRQAQRVYVRPQKERYLTLSENNGSKDRVPILIRVNFVNSEIQYLVVNLIIPSLILKILTIIMKVVKT